MCVKAIWLQASPPSVLLSSPSTLHFVLRSRGPRGSLPASPTTPHAECLVLFTFGRRERPSPPCSLVDPPSLPLAERSSPCTVLSKRTLCQPTGLLLAIWECVLCALRESGEMYFVQHIHRARHLPQCLARSSCGTRVLGTWTRQCQEDLYQYVI